MSAVNDACNCCAEPPCPTPVLEFLSISSYTLCREFLNPVDGQWYDTETITETQGGASKVTKTTYGQVETVVEGIPVKTCEPTVTCSGSLVETTTTTYVSDPTGFPDYPDCSHTAVYTSTATRTYSTVDGVCEESVTYAGSSSGHSDDGVATYAGDCTSTQNPDGTWTGTVTPVHMRGESDPEFAAPWAISDWCTTFISDGVFGDYCFCCVEGTSSTSETTSETTYSNEGEPVFPEWHTWDTLDEDLLDGQGHLDFAEMADDKVKTALKWRVKNLPSGTCYLRVLVKKTFTPAPDPEAPPGTADPEPVITIIPVEWTGTGNPCFEFPLLGAGHADNTVHTAEVVNPDPETNGTDTFEVLKYACVPGYEPEPGNPAKPNGYPSPGGV